MKTLITLHNAWNQQSVLLKVCPHTFLKVRLTLYSLILLYAYSNEPRAGTRYFMSSDKKLCSAQSKAFFSSNNLLPNIFLTWERQAGRHQTMFPKNYVWVQRHLLHQHFGWLVGLRASHDYWWTHTITWPSSSTVGLKVLLTHNGILR